MNGNEKANTIFGGLVSVAICITLLLYAAIKLSMLVNRENPNVSTFTEEFALTSDDRLNLK